MRPKLRPTASDTSRRRSLSSTSSHMRCPHLAGAAVGGGVGVGGLPRAAGAVSRPRCTPGLGVELGGRPLGRRRARARGGHEAEHEHDDATAGQDPPGRVARRSRTAA